MAAFTTTLTLGMQTLFLTKFRYIYLAYQMRGNSGSKVDESFKQLLFRIVRLPYLAWLFSVQLPVENNNNNKNNLYELKVKRGIKIDNCYFEILASAFNFKNVSHQVAKA
jgi:hypothetical protein